MNHIRNLVDSQRQSESRARRLCRITKILSCGSMVATAILFPLAYAYAGGLWFGAVTLAIFILAALVFHSLHIEPFVRCGPYTAPIALLFLLLAVLPAGSSRKELAPWLPLFIVFCSLGTVAVDKTSQNLGLRRVDEFVPEELSGVSIDSWSEESFRTVSDRHGRRAPSQSNRAHSIYFGHYGPSSHYSPQTRSESDITLAGVTGQFRSSWDPQTQGYFDTDNLEPVMDLRGQSPTWMDRDSAPEEDLTSESPSNKSNHPLLGPQ